MKQGRSNVVKILLTCILLVCVILPLLQMLINLDLESVRKVITAPNFSMQISNSLKVALTATVISVAVAMLLAFCISRSNIRYKSIFRMVLILPMLIPSISHGMGLIILFGQNGILTRLLDLNFSIYGFTGIVVGSVMYSFPVAFLMLSDVLEYEDASPYEAADVLGISKLHQFTGITLPYLSKSLISVVFSVFTMIITDYGVPQMIGGKYQTLPTVMYQAIIGSSDFGQGSVIGAILLLPAVVAFILDIAKKDSGRSSYITKKRKPAPNKLRDGACYTLCTVFSILVIIPIATFALLTFVKRYPLDMTPVFDHVAKTFGKNGGEYLINSLLISLLVAVVGTAVAYLNAYCTARMPGKASRLLHLFSIISMAIPGLVLGLSYVLFFKGSFLYGTLAILVLVNMVHFFSSPYLMIYNTFNIINKNLEDVGATLNISRVRILFDVLIPQTKGTLMEMMSYFFVNSMMTISAVSFLSNVSTKPVSLMITQFSGQSLLECSACVSLMILCINVLMKVLVYGLKKAVRSR